MSNAKLNELNELVKNSNNVKIIVLADGTVQAVDIDATNVKDEHPDAEPYAEVKGTKVSIGVQQRESVTNEEEVKTVTKRGRAAKKDKVVEPVVVEQEKVVEPVVEVEQDEVVEPVVEVEQDEVEITGSSVTDVTEE